MDNRIEIIKGDITTLALDAIVNAANASLMGGGGVDGAIHRAAGPELKSACRLLKGCRTGDAKITLGFNLKAKFVIHTVGPVWNNGINNEESLLASAYRRSLEVAIEKDIKSIAFPSISTGSYRFPFDKACSIALSTITGFIKENEGLEKVMLVVYSNKDFRIMNQIAKIVL